MKFNTVYEKTVILDLRTKSMVKFNEKIEFSVTPQFIDRDNNGSKFIFYLTDFKGDFQMTKIYGGNQIIEYENELKAFTAIISKPETDRYGKYAIRITFLLNARVEFEEVCTEISVHELKIDSIRMKMLAVFQYFKDSFVVSGYKKVEFKYYVKKVAPDIVEIYIENPQKVKIYEYDMSSIDPKNIEDFIWHQSSSEDINLKLIIDFNGKPEKNEDKTAVDGNENPKPMDKVSPLYEIMSDTTYADCILFSSSGKEIPTYRCVLAKYSQTFKNIFDESKDIPAIVKIPEFDTEIIKAALDFCYGKNDAIQGNEAKMFEFAVKYCFSNLKDACSHHFKSNVNPSNVCEIVEIAYANNFESLKRKCHKILTEQKDKIDPNEIKKLSKEVLLDLLYVK